LVLTKIDYSAILDQISIREWKIEMSKPQKYQDLFELNGKELAILLFIQNFSSFNKKCPRIALRNYFHIIPKATLTTKIQALKKKNYLLENREIKVGIDKRLKYYSLTERSLHLLNNLKILFYND
jgi:hypothetical protein